jgi:hypothetical protein
MRRERKKYSVSACMHHVQSKCHIAPEATWLKGNPIICYCTQKFLIIRMVDLCIFVCVIKMLMFCCRYVRYVVIILQVCHSTIRADNTGQQRFCPMRKNVCFWCIFGRWIQIWFQNFSITHSFRVASDHVKAQAYICESVGACRR